tara:strand:- start:1938 stop:2759 length:822 start_codon:yes stop_codon:yes gene_type:complete
VKTEMPEYLTNLVRDLQKKADNNEQVLCRIIEPKESGFQVKVQGLFAYLPYVLMPWFYPSFEFWKAIGPQLIGKHFLCEIESINENPIQIKLNAKKHELKDVDLTIGKGYFGIVVKKTDYGLFFDAGYQYRWACGGIIGLLHRKDLLGSELYDYTDVGDEVIATYRGVKSDGTLAFSKDSNQSKFLTGQLNYLIGTKQEAVVKISEEGKKEYYILGKYRGTLSVNKLLYPDEEKLYVKNFIADLEDGDLIDCEVVKINKDNISFQLKLIENNT